MAEYNKLIEKIDNAFAQGKKLKITAHDIEYLSVEEINGLQNRINQHNFEYIDKSEEKGIIDKDAANYLRKVYANAQETIQQLLQNISYSLMSEYRPEKLKKLEQLGEDIAPEEINAIDTSTGEIEQNSQDSQYGNMPKYKEYQRKHVTPFTSMRLTYYDFRDNPIYEITPGLKDVRRAVDKIKQPVYDDAGKCIALGGKYYNQYQKDIAKLQKKYKGQQLKQALADLPKPYERLKDIVRLTITRKYYQDTIDTLNLFRNDAQYGVNDAETKDSFHGNTNNSSAYETKNYRDKKVYFNLNGIKAEVQIKITQLHKGDVITSKIYAGEEDDESRNDNILLISKQNTQNKGLRFWEENKNRYLTVGDKKIVDMNILEKQLFAQKVNKKNIREYNLQVLDKAFRMEDAKRANGKDFDAVSVNPISKKEEKIHKIVAKFIKDNFMYRPFKAFDMQQKFNVTDEELRALGLVITKAQLDDMFDRYAEVILPKYNGRIDGNEAQYFSKPENQAQISAQFKKSAYNEQTQEALLPDNEELEMMDELDKHTLNSQRYDKILAKKKRFYNNKKRYKPSVMLRNSNAKLR